MNVKSAAACILTLILVVACQASAIPTSPARTVAPGTRAPVPSTLAVAPVPAPNSTLPAPELGTPAVHLPRATGTPPVLPSPIPGGVLKNVTYCTPGGVAEKMDLYFPRNLATPVPVVLYVHGGAWRAGNKSEGEAVRDAPEFTGRGYLVVSIDYRLAPQYRWPAQIEDVKCAVRYLRTFAANYKLDPQRIAAMGSSAGGHLVSLLGLAGPDAGFDVGEYLSQSSRVRAVVDLYGPSDLMHGFTTQQSSVALDWFGSRTPDPAVLAQASPVTYVSKDSPPFLIVQGDRDTLVLPTQSKELDTSLRRASVPATLIMVQNAGHGLVPSGGPISPTLPALTQSILNFLDKNVK